VRWLPEPAWWGPTDASHWWTSQPFSHAVGGIMEATFAIVLWWPMGGWRPVVFAGGVAAFWQLLNVEWKPENAYPFRWAIYDSLTAMLTASAVILLQGVI